MPFTRSTKRHFKFKEFIILSLAIAVSVSFGVCVYAYLQKIVEINDNGKLFAVKTMSTTVEDVLNEYGITVKSEDYINLNTQKKLQKLGINKIYIKRAVPVNVMVDGKLVTIMTYRDTVQEALKYSTVKLSEDDKLEGVEFDDKITQDMQFKVIRVKGETTSEKLTIPYKTEKRKNYSMDKGDKKVVRKGKEGIREKIYKLIYEDNKIVSKTLMENNIVLKPISMIIELGTIMSYKISRSDTIRYTKVYDMSSTSYTASYEDTGKHPGDPGFGRTATGMKAKKGVVAVDPSVIPLGTRVYVECYGKVNDYGYALAADTGGAIHGNKIDLYFETKKEVANWGRRPVKVYILEK